MIAALDLWNETWRWGSSILILTALSVFWWFVVTRITPFPGTERGPGPFPDDDEEPVERYPRLRSFTVKADVFLFVYIVLEGFFVIPFLFIKYGMH